MPLIPRHFQNSGIGLYSQRQRRRRGGVWAPHFQSEVQHRPFSPPGRGKWPEGGIPGPLAPVIPGPGRLESLRGRAWRRFPGSAGPPPGRVASVRAQGGRSPTGARTDATSKSCPPPSGAAIRAVWRRAGRVREGGPGGTPRRASGSRAPCAVARSGGPAPLSPPRR